MKPDEEIPQWAWDDASKVAEYINDTTVLHSLVMNAAARAILQARSQAFEDAAEEARRWLLAADASEKAADLISQAIRQRKDIP